MAWLKSRNVRKFLRSKSAVAALVVIAAFCLIAVAVVAFDLITLEETERRVADGNVPGFFRQPSPEKRLEIAEGLIEWVINAERLRDAPDDVMFIKEMGGLPTADVTRDEFEQILEETDVLIAELASSVDLDNDASLLPKLEELEVITDALIPYPTGRAGFVRNMQLCLGTDKQGRSIFLRGVYSINVAIQIGAVTALLSVLIGSLLGCAAGYFGGWVDHVVIWLYTTLSSIPGIVLLVLVAYIFSGLDVAPLTNWLYEATGEGIDWRDWNLERSLFPVYVAFCSTFWIGPCRVMRGETLKIKNLEYVQAATAIGFGRFYIMFRHILPNAAHLMLINFSLLFIGAVKSEVILSFLGLGVKEGPSWGIMINQSRAEVINGFFWQIGAATAFMFVLVLAFNILSDALQDVFDPKHL
ncbi:MAG: hypothetical protein CMJ48_02545 [Planctomycetaceae bacterium]|nr:hypothetical protein [Planctomycetaceae bacterium]